LLCFSSPFQKENALRENPVNSSAIGRIVAQALAEFSTGFHKGVGSNSKKCDSRGAP
jgi:hypothetical protein